MENQNFDFFILTYKNFKQQVHNPCYKVVTCSDEKINTTLDVLYDTEKANKENGINESITDWNSFYSELTMTYWINKNYPIKDYVGICQYRRYFNFMDNIPNMDNIFKTYDVILPEFFQLDTSIEGHYKKYHNELDLKLMCDVINDLYPQYVDTTKQVLKNNKLYACNMLIMKKEDFHKYCDFVFDVVEGYLDKINVFDLSELKNRLDEYWPLYYKPFYPNNTKWYQARIGGFLAERILTIFVKHNFKKIKHYPMVITENKYSKK